MPPVALRAGPDIVLTPVSPAEPCSEMAFDPTHASRIAAVSGDTAHLTVDGGRTWTSVSIPAAVACPPSYAAWQYFISQGNRPACEAIWGGNRLYLALDGAVERYNPDDPSGGWRALASRFPTGPCRCPEETAITSFSASPAGRWALAFVTGSGIGLDAWIESGDGAAHDHLLRGWGGRVWTTPNGYDLWGGQVTQAPMDVLVTGSYRPYASTDGVAWTPVPTNASVDSAVRQFAAVGQGVLYGLQRRGPLEPPILQVSRDGGRTWTGHTLWAPGIYFDQLWAGGDVVALTACSLCTGPPTRRIHPDALYVSLDEGATWHAAVGLPAFPRAVGTLPHILRVAVSGHRIWVAVGHAPYWYTGALP